MDNSNLKRSISKQMGFLFLGRSSAFIFTFFIPVILVRLFSVEQFGLYKQVFLISGTLLMLLRFGMEPSLFYFLPKEPESRNIYISQTILFYLVVAILAFILSFVAHEWIARLMSSPSISELFPFIVLFTAILLISYCAETIMISLKQASKASLLIFASDASRAILIISAALYFCSVRAIVFVMIFLAVARLLVLLAYLYKSIGFSFCTPRSPFLSQQVTYGFPLGFAALFRHFSQTIHFYIVSYAFDVAAFAIYSIGFFQVPLIGLFFDSIVETSMVRITELAKEHDTANIVNIMADVLTKLSIVFFPAFAFLFMNSKEIIFTLYTPTYENSVPIFMIAILYLPLGVFDFNYVLRALGHTKFLLWCNLIRLFLSFSLVLLFLKYFNLVGAAIGVMLSLFTVYLIIFLKVKRCLKIPSPKIIPFKNLLVVFVCVAITTLFTYFVKNFLNFHIIYNIIISFICFSCLYVTLIFKSRLLSEELVMFLEFIKNRFNREVNVVR